ncbi:MAG: YcnI family protein [Corynebacteriales bacterium]|nr:YcnI family protein [Mycobacteriales bacterium]
MLRRTLAAGVCAAAAVLLFAAPASAHVTVNPDEAPKGGYAKLTFRVPNEEDDASTNKLEVVFDDKAPIVSARTKPMPGWTAEIKKRPLDAPVQVHGTDVTEAIESITWTAAPGSEIKPGEFGEFDISVGPLPENTDKVVFKALQSYTNGETVRWIEEAVGGSEEPEKPAPVLTLTKAESDHHGNSAATEDHEETATSDDGKKWGIAGLIVGGLGLAVGAFALVRTRKA